MRWSDYGWADAGWHRIDDKDPSRDVLTPNMNQLVAEGIEMDRHYVYKCVRVGLRARSHAQWRASSHSGSAAAQVLLAHEVGHPVRAQPVPRQSAQRRARDRTCRCRPPARRRPAAAAAAAARIATALSDDPAMLLQYNPADPVSGMAAIPRNMTGMAMKMSAGGYKVSALAGILCCFPIILRRPSLTVARWLCVCQTHMFGKVSRDGLA